MNTFNVTDKRHAPKEPVLTITDFIEARLVELEQGPGSRKARRNPVGDPCPLAGCKFPIATARYAVVAGEPGDFEVVHMVAAPFSEVRLGNQRGPDLPMEISCQIDRKAFEQLTSGPFTAEALRMQRMAASIRNTLGEILAYEMSLDIDRGSGQGRVDAETVDAILALATIWSDHPDYKPEWSLT